MRYIKKLPALLVLFLSLGQAPACEVSTTARALNITGTEPAFQTLDAEQGHYVATFENGDLLLAAFSQCGLGMHAHYYSRTALNEQQRAERLAAFLAAVLPNQEVYKRLQGALAQAVLRDGQVIGIPDTMDSHDFVFQAAESPLFHTVIHYTWIAPQF